MQARRFPPWWTAAALAAAFATTPGWAQTAADDAPPAIPGQVVSAIWVQHEFTFTYFGRGTYYSCDGLRNKIEYLLEAVGAEKDPRVTVSCFDAGGIQQLPSARIRVAVPAEVTPELLEQLAADQSKRELVARVQGRSDGVDTATAEFPAERRVVEFQGRRNDPIGDSDCELLEQMLPRVLEPLGVRMTPDSRLSCVPGQSPAGSVRVKLEGLHQKPAPDAAPVKP